MLIVEYGDRKFIDSEPPLVYLLQIIWDALFVRYASGVPKDEENGWIPLKVSLATVTSDLQQYFGFVSTGARSPEVPRPSFVRKALDALVDFKIAERTKDEYFIKYKRTRADTLKRFGTLLFNLTNKKAKAEAAKPPRLPGI